MEYLNFQIRIIQFFWAYDYSQLSIISNLQIILILSTSLSIVKTLYSRYSWWSWRFAKKTNDASTWIKLAIRTVQCALREWPREWTGFEVTCRLRVNLHSDIKAVESLWICSKSKWRPENYGFRDPKTSSALDIAESQNSKSLKL